MYMFHRNKILYKNKPDDRGIVIKNKARLAARGYTQKDGIDNEDVFAPVARSEAIRLYLVYSLTTRLTVYQRDVKPAFRYGKIDADVYAAQPLGFENPFYSHKVFKLTKLCMVFIKHQ